MKKISNLGRVLTRDEAKKIVGGDYGDCHAAETCAERRQQCNCTPCCAGLTCSADIDGSARYCGI